MAGEAESNRVAIHRVAPRLTALFLIVLSAAYADVEAGWQSFTAKDYECALREWLPLAKQGNAKAQTLVAMLYGLGRGVAKDEVEAAKWYRLAAEQGDAGSESIVGTDYLYGSGVPQDYKEAEKWLRRAVEHGDKSALLNLGAMYHFGWGVSQNDAEALKYYRSAAQQSDHIPLPYGQGSQAERRLSAS